MKNLMTTLTTLSLLAPLTASAHPMDINGLAGTVIQCKVPGASVPEYFLALTQELPEDAFLVAKYNAQLYSPHGNGKSQTIIEPIMQRALTGQSFATRVPGSALQLKLQNIEASSFPKFNPVGLHGQVVDDHNQVLLKLECEASIGIP